MAKDTSSTKCRGPCSAKTKEQAEGMGFNPDCPKCMEIWCKFLETNNLYVVTDKQ